MTPLADRIRATIRQDVASMHGYAIQPSAGLVKLDAMESPYRLPPAMAVGIHGQRETAGAFGSLGSCERSG